MPRVTRGSGVDWIDDLPNANYVGAAGTFSTVKDPNNPDANLRNLPSTEKLQTSTVEEQSVEVHEEDVAVLMERGLNPKECERLMSRGARKVKDSTIRKVKLGELGDAERDACTRFANIDL